MVKVEDEYGTVADLLRLYGDALIEIRHNRVMAEYDSSKIVGYGPDSKMLIPVHYRFRRG